MGRENIFINEHSQILKAQASSPNRIVLTLIVLLYNVVEQAFSDSIPLITLISATRVEHSIQAVKLGKIYSLIIFL